MQHLEYEPEDWIPWWNATEARLTTTTAIDLALLVPLLQKTWMEQLVPIVLEPAYDLESQIEAATNWVVNHTTSQFRDTSSLSIENDDTTNKKKDKPRAWNGPNDNDMYPVLIVDPLMTTWPGR
jgi:hypothetical protein